MEKARGAYSSSSPSSSTKAVCSNEAMELLNCVTESPYDQDKCIRLLQSLRQCVLTKKVKKFTLAEESGVIADSKSKES